MVTRGIIKQKLDSTDVPPEMRVLLLSRVEPYVDSLLNHVHVFRPPSSLTLLATLRCLDVYLLDLKRHFSSSRSLHAIVVDSATAFIWQDKLRDDIARVEEIGLPYADVERERANGKSFQVGVLYIELIEELRRLQKKFGCAIIFTCLSWGPKRSNTAGAESGTTGRTGSDYGLYSLGAGVRSQGPSLRTSLPSPWGIFPHLRLIVQREGAGLSPVWMRVHDWERHYHKNNKFSVSINSWNSEGWPYTVVQALNRHRYGFSFHADGEGVRVSTE